jgi:hypothetical protein
MAMVRNVDISCKFIVGKIFIQAVNYSRTIVILFNCSIIFAISCSEGIPPVVELERMAIALIS